jgi:hypothetical protein
MTEADESKSERLLRRKQAAKYVVETYSLPCSPKTLSDDSYPRAVEPYFRLYAEQVRLRQTRHAPWVLWQ